MQANLHPALRERNALFESVSSDGEFLGAVPVEGSCFFEMNVIRADPKRWMLAGPAPVQVHRPEDSTRSPTGSLPARPPNHVPRVLLVLPSAERYDRERQHLSRPSGVPCGPARHAKEERE